MNIYKSIKRSFLCLVVPALSLALGITTLGGLLLLFEPGPSRAASGSLSLNLTPFAGGFKQPLGIVNAGGNDDRLFVVEKAGVIKIVQPDGNILSTPFLSITTRVDSNGGEEGLLGLVFHPDYATNGQFFLNYIHTTGGGVRLTRISRFSVTGDPNIADPDSEEILLTVEQPQSNHNAGDMHFGPDGYLYIPLGDGGGTGDPGNNAQDLENLLGAIVRIDVDPDDPASDCNGLGSGNYAIPVDNPFSDGPGGVCDEIWAYGFRNPWRFSFDRQTGDMYIGDVGQGDWEEIDFQPAGSTGGQNYGWSCYEGTHLYPPGTSRCNSGQTYTFPIFEYNHDDGCSVTGGYVYRGSKYPVMQGRYLLTDFCSGIFWDLAPSGETWQSQKHILSLSTTGYVTFGEDIAGELYVANINNGTVYRIEELTPSSGFSHSLFFPLFLKNN